jgi:hypothetical protein
MLRTLALLLPVLFIATPLVAAVATRDAYVPIAGRASGAGGRGFFTSVWVTNVADEPASVTLSFLHSARANPSPFTYTQRLAPGELRKIELPDYLLAGGAGIGALRVQSTRDVLTEAHVYSVVAGEAQSRAVGAAIAAIPAQYAIGSNESTFVQGVATPGTRYKLYVVETVGHPLYFTLTLADARGRTIAEKRCFVSGREQRAYDVQAAFPNRAGAMLKIRGFNGSGKIVATGVAVSTESQDSTAFSMLLPSQSRHRMPAGELLAYVAIAVAAVASALRPLRAVL